MAGEYKIQAQGTKSKPLGIGRLNKRAMSCRPEPTSLERWVFALAACMEKFCKSSVYSLARGCSFHPRGTVPGSQYPPEPRLWLNWEVGAAVAMEVRRAGITLFQKTAGWDSRSLQLLHPAFIPSKMIPPSAGKEQCVCSYTGLSPSGGARETRVTGPRPPASRLGQVWLT